MIDIDAQMKNYEKVKQIVLAKLVDERLLSQDDADEFSDRCQVLVYKGKWFSKWFDKHMKSDINKEDAYFIRMIEMRDKEDDIDRLLRNTTGNYDD